MKKNNVFWYFWVPLFSGITVILSRSPWLFELLATPDNRVFTGINRWSGDYFTYLSYVELGRRGELGAKLLATTILQRPVFAHLAHTLPGYVFGHLLSLNSIISYHLAQTIYSFIFVFLVFVFYYFITKSKTVSTIAFVLTFYIGSLGYERPLSWLQEQNIFSRAHAPLHYTTGFIFFLLSVLWFFKSKSGLAKKTVIFGLLLNLTLFANPFAYLIMGLSFGVYTIIKIISNSKAQLHFLSRLERYAVQPQRRDEYAHGDEKNATSVKDIFTIIVGFLVSLPLFLYTSHFLSQEPWGRLGVAPKYYIVTHPPIGFWETVLSIGPILILGIAGILFQLKKLMRKQIFLFMIIWLFVQFSLFFFGDYLRLDPLRSFSGLYYVPLSLFSALFITDMSKKLKLIFHVREKIIIVLVVCMLFILALPSTVSAYKDLLFQFTDFKTFSTFTYPTKKQFTAFSWLEKNTPTASGVLAMYEASSLIIGFSGNSTEVNMDQKLKVPFYSNQLSRQEAKDFLKNNHFRYVYVGYQEKAAGGDVSKYGFLKKIFENEEVRIYVAK